jgi:hypothetical protein
LLGLLGLLRLLLAAAAVLLLLLPVLVSWLGALLLMLEEVRLNDGARLFTMDSAVLGLASSGCGCCMVPVF